MDGTQPPLSYEPEAPPWPETGEDRAAYDLGTANRDAEVALLGALLMNNAVYERIADILEPEHFFLPVHQAIYEAIATFIEGGRQADPRTLKPYFENDPALREHGGWRYLLKLVTEVVAIVNAEDYARTIFDGWRRRRLMAMLDRAERSLFRLQLGREAGEIIAEMEAELGRLEQKGQRGQTVPEDVAVGIDRYLEEADRAHKSGGALIGVTTGIRALDEKTGGLHPSDLLVLAARPGMGKTALALNIARAAAEAELAAATAENRPPRMLLFFSLEMGDSQLAGRLLASHTGIPTERVRHGTLTPEEFQILFKASAWAKGLPLKIDITPGITVSQMRARAKRIQKRQGLLAVIADYIQLVEGDGENRTNVIGGITRGLKTMAKELDVPVLALSQLSRDVEKRDDKKPNLSDLRDSGSIEQDADTVWFIFREEYYLKKAEPVRRADEGDTRFDERTDRWDRALTACKGFGDIIIGKARHGPEGSVRVRWNGARQQFSDVDTSDTRQGGMFDGTAEERG